MSDLHALADEYVFGLLEDEAAEAVEARIALPTADEDRELAQLVGHLRDRMLAIDLTAPAVPPAETVWTRIEDEITRRAPAARAPDAGAEDRVVSLGAARETRSRWKVPALVSMAAAILLAAGLGWQVFRAQAPEVLVVLVNDGGSPVAVLEAFSDNSVLVTPLVEPGATPAQSLQLWTKPDPDGPPVSVGVIETAARILVPGPDLPRPTENQLYEITIEPAGGSPTGLPTGPVFGIGNAQAPLMRDG
jgi:anti-sigma-K factor RskA